ncbi:hypothetical protein ABBQ38_012478 [Trebouxia sp. C0009 RCD-2024]
MTPDDRATYLKALSAQDLQAFREICISHELSEKEVVEQHVPVINIEMFLFNFPKVCCMHLFPHLHTLMISQQAVTDIQGLEGCPNLEQLWLTENEITDIRGLGQCLQLRRLYLYSNHISCIEGLDNLNNLEVLWLADNKISLIAGLSQLTCLSELNLARNMIEVVGNSLDANKAVQSLNLADNRLGSFKQVWHLASLPNLSQLLFSDPDWGASPIAKLCNYATYAAVNLPNLQVLDSQPLSPQTKAVAEATYLKKKMYYNMRINTLRRKGADLAQQAQQGLQAHLAPLLRGLRKLQYESKAVSCELDAAATAGGLMKGGGQRQQQLREKAQALQLCIDDMLQQGAAKERDLAAACKASDAVTEGLVHRMLMELETGGNIRFEEGKANDQWFASCQQLVQSRWQPPPGGGFAHLSPHPSNTPTVLRLTRVHNRFLRSRLESKLDELKSSGTGGDRHLLEHLFFSGQPADLQRLAEEGFPQPPVQALSNSLTLALEQGIAGRREGGGGGSGGAVHHVLVAKVLTSHCQKARPYAGVAQQAGDPSAGYQAAGGDPRQRWWHVLDNALILPEYIAEVSCKPAAAGDGMPSAQQPPCPLASELPHIAAPLAPFLTLCPAQTPTPPMGTPTLPQQDSPPAQLETDTMRGLVTQEVLLNADAAAALALPPVLLPRHRTYQLSEKGVLEMTGVSMIGMLTQLNLHGSALKKIEASG